MTNFQATNFQEIKGVLFDLDGVFYEGSIPVDGGNEVLDFLQLQNIPYRFVTNTTTRSRNALVEKLKSLGIFVAADEIVTAPVATASYLKSKGYQRCHLVVSKLVVEDFADIDSVDDDPDCIVVGDIGETWDYRLLNRLFHHILAGADLVAMHKNRFWKTEAGLQMDIGGFIAALEYASGTTAQVVGKPAAEFYRAAVATLGLPAEQVLVVGDDVETDVAAGQAVGMTGVLVKTGKYRDDVLAQSGVEPEAVIGSIADLPGLFAGRVQR